MALTIDVYSVGGQDRLTVVYRPHRAASLGEYCLLESHPIETHESPVDTLREVYRAIAAALTDRALR